MIQAIHTKIATPGPGYLATSTTSATIANTGTITLTTQAGLAYTPGARVRASYTADGTKWMEGIVTSYAGTTLAFTADGSNGSGTFASWNLNLAGQPGASTSVTVGTTTTGAAGSSAAVTNSGTPYAAVLNFTVPQGAQGPAGTAVNPRGAYVSGATYAQFDGVTYSGASYISLQAANTGHQPDISPTYWQSVGSSGLADPGTNGILRRSAPSTTVVAAADDLSAPVYGTDTSVAANAITATLSPAIGAYVDGARYRVKVANANTGATTVNLNTIGAVTVKKWSSGALTDLAAGDLAAGQMADLTYDSANACMQLASGAGSATAGSVRCRAYSSAAQSIATGAWTAITLDTNHSAYDVGGLHSTSVNNSRFTIPTGKGGGYMVTVMVTIQTNGSGERYIALWKNGAGTSYAQSQIAGVPSGTYLCQTITAIVEMSDGDYVEAMVFQDSGASQNTFAGRGNTCVTVTKLW